MLINHEKKENRHFCSPLFYGILFCSLILAITLLATSSASWHSYLPVSGLYLLCLHFAQALSGSLQYMLISVFLSNLDNQRMIMYGHVFNCIVIQLFNFYGVFFAAFIDRFDFIPCSILFTDVNFQICIEIKISIGYDVADCQSFIFIKRLAIESVYRDCSSMMFPPIA